MIPKIIHYCWFGRGDKPELAKKCIASWVKFCPDYEIKEWNEDNFDVECCAYVKEAYEMKKWAFVSDYARFYILYQEGGIYFDTDVELLKSMDEIIAKGAFMGCEPISMVTCDYRNIDKDLNTSVNPGLGLGVSHGLDLFKEILNFYHSTHFIKEDGSINTTTVVEYTTSILKKYGFMGKGEIECICGVNIYPPEYFCPLNYHTQDLNITENTYSIHHYVASWKEKEELKMAELSHKLRDILPYRLAELLCFFLNSLVRLRVGIRRYGLVKSMRIIGLKIFRKLKR